MSETDKNEKPSKHRLVEVRDEVHGEDSFSVTKNSVLEGYNRLSGTFSPQQANLANSIKFEESFNKLIDLTEEQNRELKEQNKNFKEDAKKQRNYFYISTIITIMAVIIAIVSYFK